MGVLRVMGAECGGGGGGGCFLQNNFRESHFQSIVTLRALRELNAFLAPPSYFVFEDEKSNGSDEKSAK